MTETRREVRRVLLITLILNLAVAFGKIGLGLATGALAIIADGLHSLTDSTGNIAGLIANHYAGLPPDDEHPYGHRRYETLAALLIGGLLLLTAWEIGRGALERLQNAVMPEITPLSFAVLFGTLITNIFVSRYQIAAGERLQAEVLLADAKNTSADVFVTLSVIVSTAVVAFTGWVWVDGVAALLVMVLIGRAALQILRQTSNVLVDAAPYTPEHLTTVLYGIPNVQRIVRARSRGTPDAAQIDIDAQIAPEMTASQSAAIASAIEQRLHDTHPGIAEIEVHFVPAANSEPDAMLTARAAADTLGLTTHEVQVSGDMLEMHVEVPGGQTLAEAHAQVSQLESQVREHLPHIEHVVTHIEPVEPVITDDKCDTQTVRRCQSLTTEAHELLNVRFPAINWHELHARPAPNGGYALTLHAALPPQLSVEAAHAIAESAETMLRGEMRHLNRVTIHTEPFDHE